MKDCSHKKIMRGRITRNYLGGIFKSNGDRCKDCEAELWNSEVQSKFTFWIGEHYANNRHRFTLHPVLSEKVRHSIAENQMQYPGHTESSIIKALVVLYLEVVAKNPELTASLEVVVGSPNYRILTGGTAVKSSVNFKPSAMEVIMGWASLTGFTPSKVVEEALHRQLACFLAVTDEGKRIWSTVKEQFGMILMAA